MQIDEGRARVLVDDDEGVTSVVERALRRQGYEVATANSADAALQVIDSFRPGALVLDIVMPGTDGLTLCRQVRAEKPDVGLLMVSSRCTSATCATSSKRRASRASSRHSAASGTSSAPRAHDPSAPSRDLVRR